VRFDPPLARRLDTAPRRWHASGVTADQLSSTLEAVVANFAAMVRRVGSRHRLSEADVDEVMQEVRIRLWHASQRGERSASEQIGQVSASYVYKTAVSAALDILRRRRAHGAERAVPLDDPEREGAAPAAPATAGPDALAEASELAAQVARSIDAIPASRRAVVRMHLAGYPREEIASLMGWSEAKTRNLLYRGLGDLRERLTQLGITWHTST
jgi:RNA polymerase sigma-70 factor (ECF subfamily)